METLAFDGQLDSRTPLSSVKIFDALEKRMQREFGGRDIDLERQSVFPGEVSNLVLGLLTWDSLNNCHGLPYSTLGIRPGLFELLHNHPPWRSLDKPTILCNFFRVVHAHSGILAYDTFEPYSRGVTDEKRLTMLGWSWLDDPVTSEHHAEPLARPPIQRLSEGKIPWFVLEHPGAVRVGTSQLASDDRYLLILPTALDTCLTWIEDAKAFSSIPPNEKYEARATLQEQLHEVTVPNHIPCCLLIRR